MMSKTTIYNNGFSGCEDFLQMLANPTHWELADSTFTSVSAMPKDHLRQAIVECILLVTIWEKVFEKKASYTQLELNTHVRLLNRPHVTAQLYSDEVQHFLVKGTQELRIMDELLKAACEYCGVFYKGEKLFEVKHHVA